MASTIWTICRRCGWRQICDDQGVCPSCRKEGDMSAMKIEMTITKEDDGYYASIPGLIEDIFGETAAEAAMTALFQGIGTDNEDAVNGWTHGG